MKAVREDETAAGGNGDRRIPDKKLLRLYSALFPGRGRRLVGPI